MYLWLKNMFKCNFYIDQALALGTFQQTKYQAWHFRLDLWEFRRNNEAMHENV